jgi:hypothetical protein
MSALVTWSSRGSRAKVAGPANRGTLDASTGPMGEFMDQSSEVMGAQRSSSRM